MHGAQYSCNSWKTPGLSKFLPGPYKTPGKTDNFPVLLKNSWNFVEKYSTVL